MREHFVYGTQILIRDEGEDKRTRMVIDEKKCMPGKHSGIPAGGR